LSGPARKFAHIPDLLNAVGIHKQRFRKHLDGSLGTMPDIKDQSCLPFQTRHINSYWRRCSPCAAWLSKATYNNRDLANLFGVSTGSIQDWVAAEQINSRYLPGRARFLPTDIEELLWNSSRKGKK